MRLPVKPLLFLFSAAPALYIAWEIWLVTSGQPNDLGADPGKEIVLWCGTWALNFLLITLTVTPARRITGWNALARYRRMLGLFCFFYATLHFAGYLTFLLELHFGDLIADVGERPYITVGFLAFCGLVPLAATSNKWMTRRLKQRWQLLHRLVYPIALLALVHLFWLTRSDYTRFAIYFVVTALLLGYRLAKARGLRRLLGSAA